MSVHVFGIVVTALGTAANNRGLTEGNTSLLQKLIWNSQVHTTVSAEAIRFALRRRLADAEGQGTNRRYNEAERTNEWIDPTFTRWAPKSKDEPFIDDDLLGFMAAEAAKDEQTKGSTKVRRAVLEITRAVSLTPWPGDVTFNAASPGATPSAQKRGTNPVPYATEMHATRYQYGFALTPEKLHKPARAIAALEGLVNLGEVAGNHGRFLFDFSPESIILRITQDPAPRLLYGFGMDGNEVHAREVLRKVEAGDIAAEELIVGGAIASSVKDKLAGAAVFDGVKAACAAAVKRIA
jgi:CRISPR-associated protein Cst2